MTVRKTLAAVGYASSTQTGQRASALERNSPPKGKHWPLNNTPYKIRGRKKKKTGAR